MNIKGMVQSFAAMLGFDRHEIAPVPQVSAVPSARSEGKRTPGRNSKKARAKMAQRSKRNNRGVTAHGRSK